MSLPNEDDDDGRRPPGRTPFRSDGISPIKKLTVALDEDDEVDDEQTSAETSIGSMSFASDLTSVVAGAGAGTGAGAAGAAPQTTAAIIGNATPMSALTMETRAAAHEVDSNSIRSSGSNHSRLDYDESAVRERRRNNLRQLQQLGIATGVTFSMFLYLLVPTALLMSMILFGGVSAAFMARLAVYLQWEFNRSILEGRGIGDYLPQGMYEALTSSSLNDILTDPDGIFGVSEHMPYILLYMIPGLTREQRDAYVGQLSPHHQRLLRNEHGLLGYLHNRNRHLNPNNGEASSFLMRLLMGDERLRQQQQLLQMQNTRVSSSSNRLELPPTIPEGVSWGDTSHLGADDDPTSASSGLGASGTTPITTTAAAVASTIATRQENPPSSRAANSAANDIPATVSPIVGRAVVLNEAPQQAVDRSTPTLPPARARASISTSASTSASASASAGQNNSTRPQLDRDNSERRIVVDGDFVLFDAIGTAMSNIVGTASQSVRIRAQESVQSALRGPVLRASIGVTALGLTIGAYGLLSGTYTTESLARPLSELFRGIFGGSSGSSSGDRSSSFSLPASSLLVGATLTSGTTAVVLGAIGFYQGDDGASDKRGKSRSEKSHPAEQK
mmetsp:Transcript_6777/g.19621  ORF Transcript_6777/g.19621 Transcript_6777/m.19621 type:complete len:617 (+) Transcript_6777:361-2211(+)